MPSKVRALHPDQSHTGPEPRPHVDFSQDHAIAGTVLLAVSSSGNRRRLLEQLGEQYQIIEPEYANETSIEFDLAITDISSIQHWGQTLLDAKVRSEPTFLPTILLVSKNELKHKIHQYWDTVDEFIVTPIDRLEFAERVAMLMRARYLAKSQQAQLAYLASHDRITGLPNKQRFMEKLADSIFDASILGQSVHIVVFQLNLQRIMNSLGHRGLDKAAAICTSRLRTLLSADGTYMARLTTETWGLILPSDRTLESVVDTCRRLKSITDSPLDIYSERIHINITSGVGIYPDDAPDPVKVLDCAINALGIASEGTIQFYSQSVQHSALRFIRTETRLRQALAENQFELWYQPQINLSDMSVTGVEALVRWRLPNGHLAPPGEFMNVAIATGLIVPLDRWVLHRACEDMQNWRRDQLGLTRVAVNITSEDVEEDSFVDFVRNQLEQFDLPPPTVELELTETTILEVDDRNLRKLNELRSLGLDIAIDDFGTGYSSLNYLHKLPITILKIDKSFIQNILTEETDAAITKTVVWLADNFKLQTVAEGVETLEQAQCLQALKVDKVQGYYYGKPMPEAEFKSWLADWNARVCSWRQE